ncbi:hypothetical protein J2749_001245 [Methanobacterium oryzae]
MVIMPSASAWKWTTHSQIIDKTYNAMPYSIKTHLSLSAMRDGSNDPDEKFHDTRCHSYPYSINKTNYWLSKGNTYYKMHNYYQASYCFGVASHYISDTFSAPHCVSGETSYMHTKYETQGGYLKPYLTSASTTGTVNSLLYSGYSGGKSDWSYWMKTKSSSIVQKDLNKAASTSYRLIRNNVY